MSLHVLAAVLWLGGMFCLATVGAPVLRQLEPALRAELFRQLGEQFRRVGRIPLPHEKEAVLFEAFTR